ncbi:hypothetical protein KR222_006891 [Zaprionus bogoriensis]|nr:hypothetical protein KR222_006891 [Zaprionus bogoriensis]
MVEFTNVKCIVLDKDIGDFEFCYIKSVNRSYKYVSVKAILKKPSTDLWVNLSLLKRANGYKPFLYNITVDVCKFMKKGSNSVDTFFASLFRPYSNLNHTCPFKDSLQLEKLPANFLNSKLTTVLPMPNGDNSFSSKWIVHSIPFVELNLFITLS